jgi:NAD(P)H dehydrogenase (quinone)
MKVLVVYAHPNPKSFSHAIMEEFTRGLGDSGHTFETVDLYGIGFDPRMTPEDLAQFRGGQMPEDVREQQGKVAQAQGLAFISPVYWGNVAAILEGWFQRVFSMGFAFGPPQPGKVGPSGLLTHAKALLMCPTMAKEPLYEATGVDAAMKTRLVDYVLKYCGVKQADCVLLHGASFDAEARKKHLERVYQLGKDF